jgi:GNAT superfamily N-acetyltransferase
MLLVERLGYPLSLEDMENRVRIYTTHPDYKLFVSTDAQTITGFVALNYHEMMVLPSRKMRIEGLVIDLSYRRQGIALQLMHKAEAYAKASGCSVIELTSGMHRASSGGHNFYNKLGYGNDGAHAKAYLRKVI